MRTAIPACEKRFFFVSQIQEEDQRSRRRRATMELKWFWGREVRCDECLDTWNQDFPDLQANREKKDEQS
jgi:hypothetical protein